MTLAKCCYFVGMAIIERRTTEKWACMKIRTSTEGQLDVDCSVIALAIYLMSYIRCVKYYFITTCCSTDPEMVVRDDGRGDRVGLWSLLCNGRLLLYILSYL